MANQIDDYVKRPIRYLHIDGLGELVFGVMWTGFILLGSLLKAAPSGSFWQVYAAFLVCLAALTFGLLYGYKALKKRITYPRTGYVKYRRAGKRVRRIAGMLTGLATGFATNFVLRPFASQSYETALMVWTSVGWGLLYIFVTRMDEAWRWVVLVALIVAPPVVATLPLGRLWLHTLPFVLQGLIFFVSGAIALALYLRRNPVPEQVAE
jgi:hypothetical protein